MSYVRYTKTSTFLFPLLGISKELFQCDVRSTFGNTIMTNRFLNSYLIDEDLDSEKYNKGPYLFLIIKNYRDPDFDGFYDTLTSFDCYEDEYEKAGFLVVVCKIPEESMVAYNLLMDGKYSEISDYFKEQTIKNAFYSGSRISILPLIFRKSKTLRESWEKRLSGPTSEVDLGDNEVWSIIDLDKESFCNEALKKLNKHHKDAINKSSF